MINAVSVIAVSVSALQTLGDMLINIYVDPHHTVLSKVPLRCSSSLTPFLLK